MRHWFVRAWLAACPWLAPGQIAILQIQVVEGEGGVHAAGTRAQRPLVVEVTDETGRPAAAAAVTFTLPEDGPGGTFTNGLRTEVITADARGRVTLRSLLLNRNPGRFSIRITASLEQARAGTVSFQYINGPQPRPGAAASRATAPAPPAAKPSHRKWIVIVALAGAAAAGLGAGITGGRGTGGSTPPSATPAAAVPAPLTIGAPTITIGRP